MFKDLLPDINLDDLEPVCTASVDSILFDSFPDPATSVDVLGHEKIKAEEMSSAESLESSSFSYTSTELVKQGAFGDVQQFVLSSISPSEAEQECHGKQVASICETHEIPFLNLDTPAIPPNVDDFVPRMSESASSESHTTNVNPIHTSTPYTLDTPMFYTPQVIQETFGAPISASIVDPQFGYPVHNVPLPPPHPVQYYASHQQYAHPPLSFDPVQPPFSSPPLQTRDTKRSASSKRYKLTQPSKFCHVCVRSGDQVRLAPCANVISGLCRKAVCEKCFEKHGFGHEWNTASLNYGIISEIHNRMRDQLPESAWTCFHCRSQCPSSAQCKIYARTNRRRHIILKQRKAAKERASAVERNAANASVSTAIGKGRKKGELTKPSSM